MSRNNKIEGIGSVTSGRYDVVSIEGIGKVKGDIVCEELHIEGLYKGVGKVETFRFSCEGMSRILADMKAKEVKIEGIVKVRGAKLEAESIICEGMLTCTEEVSADSILIDGICSVARMYGDEIKIKYANLNNKGHISKGLEVFARTYIGRRVSQEHSIIDVIECSQLEADHLESKVIKAHNIKLGPNCQIEHIECDGHLEYDESCHIGKIVAEHVTKQSYNNKKGEIDMADAKLTKILDLYKESKVNADEAEQMILSLGMINRGEASMTSSDFKNDKLRVVVMKGDKLISQKEYNRGMTINVEYQGDTTHVECWGNLTCGDVNGNAHVGGNIKAGNIGGNASSGGSIECNNIKGNVSTGSSITCKDVGGNISAGGGVRIVK